MPRRWTAGIAFAVALLTSLASLAFWAQPALAFDCTQQSKVFLGFQWTRTGGDVDGVRAPIQTRFDGGLCDNFSASVAAVWIGIQQTNGNGITQEGVLHDYVDANDVNSGTEYCRFWAIGTGRVVHETSCHDTDKTFYFFQIHTFDAGTMYVISDCGTTGIYDPDHCDTLSSSQPAYTDPEGEVQMEVHKACDVHIMGDSSDQQNVGDDEDPVQGLDDSGTWSARQWGDIGASPPGFCSNVYNDSEQNFGQTMKFYDSRNSQ